MRLRPSNLEHASPQHEWFAQSVNTGAWKRYASRGRLEPAATRCGNPVWRR